MNTYPRYKAVIFDLDGTLLDTVADLGEAVNHSLALRGFPLHGIAEYRQMVGHGVRDLVTKALPEGRRGDTALVDACLADFRAWYTTHIDVHTRPYAGLPELLEALQEAGVQIAVASNKFQAGTEQLIRRFFPRIRFTAVLGNREGFPLKPDPEIVAEVLRRTGCRPGDAVLVGDSLTDLKTAENGGIAGIAVCWGYRSFEGMRDITLADSPAALRAILWAEALS